MSDEFKMNATILFLAIAFILGILLTGCKKAEKLSYDIVLTVQGQGVYNYVIGNQNGSGHCETIKTITGTANIGDVVTITAISDSLNTGICVEMNKPDDVKNCGTGRQTRTYTFN